MTVAVMTVYLIWVTDEWLELSRLRGVEEARGVDLHRGSSQTRRQSRKSARLTLNPSVVIMTTQVGLQVNVPQ